MIQSGIGKVELCLVEHKLRGCHISQQRIRSSVFRNGVLLPFKDDGAQQALLLLLLLTDAISWVFAFFWLSASVISREEWDKYYTSDVRDHSPCTLTTSLPLPVPVKRSVWITQEKNIYKSECREGDISPCLILSLFKNKGFTGWCLLVCF